MIEIVNNVKPSARVALEISCVNQAYLERGDLNVEVLDRGLTWPDTGTHECLLEATMFVETLEKRQYYKVACLEEIAWHQGWLSDDDILTLAAPLSKNNYDQYLLSMVKENK